MKRYFLWTLALLATILLWPFQDYNYKLQAGIPAEPPFHFSGYPEDETHVIDYDRFFRAQSVLDGRMAFLDTNTNVRVVGEYDGRHIILWDHNKTVNLIDRYYEGKPVLLATPTQTNATCADVVQVDGLVLLKQPISQEELAQHEADFAWPAEVTLLDYLDFGLPKGTECVVTGEEGAFWKVNLLRGDYSYVGYIPKQVEGLETLQRNCDMAEVVPDSRESFEGMSYPDWVEGTFEAYGEGMQFTLEVFQEGYFLKGNLRFYHPRMGWNDLERIDVFYSPTKDRVSFPGIMNRCEIRMIEGDQIGAVDGNYRFRGTRTE